MANSITQTVMWNGSGDYTSLVTGINGIIASGVADPNITVFNLIVDSGYYYGVFNVTIPNSGQLGIYGSGTWFAPNNVCFISGNWNGQTNLVIDNLRLTGTGLINNALSIAEGTYCAFNDIHYFGGSSGIISSGNLSISQSDALGTGGGYFVASPTGVVNLQQCNLASFGTAVSGITVSCLNSKLLDNKIGIYISGALSASSTLIHGTSGIVCSSGTIYADHLTMATNYQCITGSRTNLNITTSVLGSTNGYSISGATTSGLVSGCFFYPSGWDPALTNISGVNSSGNPLYNNTQLHDFRLKLLDTVGSPCIEVTDPGILNSGVVLITDQSQLSLNDSVVDIDSAVYRNFIYKQGNTLLLSDYEKEISFAETAVKSPATNYNLYAQAQFSVSGILVTAAIDESSSPFPYDWDFKVFDTTEIIFNYSKLPGNNVNDYEYIVPRSILDVSATISPYVGSWLGGVAFSQLRVNNITAYMNFDYRGVAYDFDGSSPQHKLMWSIEGRQQTLSKIDAISGDTLDQYPLLIKSPSVKYIYPSGLIPAGVFQGKYKYLKSSNPNQAFYSSASDGGFQWLATGLDQKKDARGIVAYKGNLYITVSEYNGDIFDRGHVAVLPENSGQGCLLQYSDNHIFNHYIANYNTANPMDNAPVRLTLFKDNAYPTDITVYEDGSLFVADYLNNSGLYQYRFAYDYALIQSSYHQNSLVLLRENYSDVSL